MFDENLFLGSAFSSFYPKLHDSSTCPLE